MKKIKLIFNGLGFYEAYIYIYDCNNNLVFNGVTCNHEIELCLEECNVYRIKAVTNNTKLVTSFFVNCNNTYRFSLVTNDNNTITFLLTDYYYNLPIERGELLLWQNQ